MSLEQDGHPVEAPPGAFVCDVSDKPGVSISSTAEIVTVEYLKRCFELGMSIEDIEAQFTECLNNEKATGEGIVGIASREGGRRCIAESITAPIRAGT